MANSAAQIGAGATMGYSSDGSSYTTLLEVSNIVPPVVSVGKAEVTRYDSPSTADEFIAGYKTNSESEFDVNYLKAQSAAVYALVGLIKYWKITFPDGTTVVFKGFVSSYGVEVPKKERMGNKIKIVVSSDIPTYTQGS